MQDVIRLSAIIVFSLHKDGYFSSRVVVQRQITLKNSKGKKTKAMIYSNVKNHSVLHNWVSGYTPTGHTPGHKIREPSFFRPNFRTFALAGS